MSPAGPVPGLVKVKLVKPWGRWRAGAVIEVDAARARALVKARLGRNTEGK